MNFIELHATIREKFGTRSAKALRKEKKVPAVIYSKTTPTQAIALDKEEVKKKLSIHHHFYLIKVDSKEYKVFLKEVQRNHLGSEIYHIDFEAVEPNKVYQIKIPLKFVGQPKGVLAGGHIEILVYEVVILTTIENVVESLTVDISDLELNQRLKIADIPLPQGIKIKSPPPNTVVIIIREPVKEEVKPAAEAVATPTAQEVQASAAPTGKVEQSQTTQKPQTKEKEPSK